MSTSRRALLSFLLVFAAAPALVSAQEAEPDPRIEEAREVFEAADAQFANGNFDEAASGFERSRELLVEAGRDTAPLIWFNIARAYERGGHDEQAREAYQHFVDEVTPTDADTQQRVQEARQAIVRLTPEPTGRPITDRPVTDPTVEDRPTTSSGGGGGVSPIGPIVMGGGGALAIVGAIMGGVALSTRSSAEERCVGTRCAPDVEATNDEIVTQALVADILLFGGAAIAVAGLVLTFVLTEDGDDASAAVRGTCGPGGCLALLEGTF